MPGWRFISMMAPMAQAPTPFKSRCLESDKIAFLRAARYNLRRMRKYTMIDALLLPTTQAVLAATVLRPQREWYLSDLAAHLRVGPSSLQRTLAKLVAGGILSRRKEGNRVYYKVDQSCPVLPELTAILTKTVGVA